jgi:uroporphyrinogen-III synthase
VSGLTGRTVVVTRPQDQAEPLAAAVRRLGGIPIPFPTIATRPLADPAPLDAAIAALDHCAWIVFTSANAVRFFVERLRAVRPAGLPATVRNAAVGPATARALDALGVWVDAVPAEFLGSAIAGALGDVRGRTVLVPRADIGRDETIEALRAAGARVLDVTAYHTVPAAPNPRGWRALEAGADAVTFTSPSTVRNFFALAGDDAARRVLAPAAIACIGPTTAEAARAAGLTVHVQPAAYTVEALVEALDLHFCETAVP